MFLLLLACATPPDLAPIEPATVAPGERLVASGARFGEDPRAFLTEGETEIALPLFTHGPGELTAQIPRATPLGEYQFVVRTAEGQAQQPVTVVEPDLERACHGLYRADNTVSASRGVIVLARTFRDGEETVEEVPVSQVSQVILTRRTLEDGRSCAGVYLMTDEGLRLFMDEAEADLSVRAKRLATALGVDLLES
ncbi:MAG: hypothetical protein EP330_08010 [Deltaproteobacteria bacterium]|nr:MAG: hypothetical protein EP330_08010 [Deltaproteobacteria bacterium]